MAAQASLPCTTGHRANVHNVDDSGVRHEYLKNKGTLTGKFGFGVGKHAESNKTLTFYFVLA